MYSSEEAISVFNVSKTYGKGKYSTPILRNFNMTVKQGTVYGLLGSSGCGKTTILSSILGLKTIDSGEIYVHGRSPGKKGNSFPAKKIGYMPQEIALVKEFSIGETLRYFGSLYGMEDSLLESNSKFLIDLLQLPSNTRKINTLSGGQQRRVSFAVALIHNPEILILDEPTVGVDSLLRKSIWSHLMNLSSQRKITVIISTHYIEEARQSHTVGLIKDGQLLTENSPETLLQLHDAYLLEDVVLKLCLQNNLCPNEHDEQYPMSTNVMFSRNRNPRHQYGDETENRNDMKIIGLAYRKGNPDLWDIETCRKWNDYNKRNNIIGRRSTQYDISTIQNWKESLKRLKSLCVKNILSLTRNIIFLLFMMVLPAATVFLIGAAIGGNIKGLKFGVVNKDLHCGNGKFDNQIYNYYEYEKFGCILYDNYTGSASLHYLSLISNFTLFSLVSYESENEALQDVMRTNLYGYVYFPENFTNHMRKRIEFGFNSEIETMLGSRITWHKDSSKEHINQVMKMKLFDWYISLVKTWATMCNIKEDYMDLPIIFSNPVYGSDTTSFTEYIAPSMLLGILFFFSLCGSGASYIMDEKSKILERSEVAGATKVEIMISYAITNFLILIIQTGLSFMCMILAFDVKIQGSLVLAIILTLIVGVAGIAHGFLCTTFCKEEIQLVLVAIGTFLPNLFLNGMIWSTVSMPKELQYFTYFLPFTLACESIRSIISRGLGINEISVWPGFVSITIWMSVYFTLTILLIQKIKK